jgi:four helix bundle protein
MAYQKSFLLAQRIYRISLKFPKEERNSLTDQIRRSSRSVSANLAEASAKRGYPKHFRSKLTDCAGETAETQVWLDYALDCGYLSESTHQELTTLSEEVGKLLSYMMSNPAKFGSKPINP